MGSLTSSKVLRNEILVMNVADAELLVATVKDKDISLACIQFDQTTADHTSHE
jgi:hypothetical protein